MIATYQKDDVTIQDPPVKDAYGSVTTPRATRVVKGRVEWKSRLVRSFAGDEVASSGVVTLSARPSEDAIITVEGETRPIVAIGNVKAFRTKFYEVFLG